MIESESIDRAALYPIVSADHDGNHCWNDPDWTDIPQAPLELRADVEDVVLDVFPTVLENGATERYMISTSVARQYLRYRLAQCDPTQSRIEAMKRTAEAHEISVPAVYEHARSLGSEQDITSFTDALEDIWFRCLADRPVLGAAWRSCAALERVGSELATICETPSISPSDITLQDVYRDQPGERSRVLTADRDVIGLPGSESADRGASVSDVERGIRRADLTEIAMERPIYLDDSATVRTRDIATYQTEYSDIVRQIFEVVQRNMRLSGKQKPGPVIDSTSDDNAAVRAVLPYPDSSNASIENFARISVQYWRSGHSNVSITTRPDPTRIHDERDPTLSGSIDEITAASIHTWLGKTMSLVAQFQSASE